MTTLELFLTMTSQVSWEIVLPWKWFVTYLANVHLNHRCVTLHGRMKFAVSLECTIPGNHKSGTRIKNRNPLCCYPHRSCRQTDIAAPASRFYTGSIYQSEHSNTDIEHTSSSLFYFQTPGNSSDSTLFLDPGNSSGQTFHRRRH